jgi:hypothetical protein
MLVIHTLDPAVALWRDHDCHACSQSRHNHSLVGIIGFVGNIVEAVMPGSNASAPSRSQACPGVRVSAVGLPRPSTTACILVLNPPLLRPMAWSSPSFFGPSCMLMRADNRAVDHRIFIVGIIGQVFEKTLPHAGFCPSAETGVNRFPGPETLRQIAPGNEFGEPSLHLIDPRRRSWREVDVVMRSARQPRLDLRGFVGGVIVHDDMDVESCGDIAIDPIEEVEELTGPVALVAELSDSVLISMTAKPPSLRRKTRLDD